MLDTYRDGVCLAAVSCALPRPSVPVRAFLDLHGLAPAQARTYERFYGFSQVHVDPGQSLEELMRQAAAGLDAVPDWRAQVRYVVAARTVQLAAPYPANPLHAVRDALGLDRAVSFVVSQHACASSLLAIDVCARLLSAAGDPGGLALILAGEKSPTPSLRLVADSAVMGDGMAACLIRGSGTADRLIAYATRSYSRYNDGPWLSPAIAKEFSQMYTKALAGVLSACARQAGIGLHDVALILPHNVNRLSWMRFSKETGFPLGRIFLDNLAAMGHCFCADPFLNYAAAVSGERLRAGDYYAMVSVGLGATFSAMIFRR